ncbi:MAG: 30S ribosomal protein S3 [Nitrososphaeraceae archaeon]|jgi:small subunit ribosomal protein S3
MSAARNVVKNNFRNLELDEFLSATLKDAGYGNVEIQRTPIGTRITLYVTRPGLVIGRKGSGIKDLTAKIEEKFGLTNPQISVQEVSIPELNPKIMCNRIAQLIERGTAFRRAALWTINTINGAGALGVEVSIAGKLRSERAHFEKHSSGVVPKSGDVAERIVKSSISHVSTKMGLMGIQIRIAIKNEVPQEFELLDSVQQQNSATLPTTDDTGSSIPPQETVLTERTETRVPTEVKTNGQS